MKRKAPMPRSGQRTGDVKKDLSKEQLESIGAVAISFNDMEFAFELFLGEALCIPQALLIDTAKRMKGHEAKNELAKIAVDYWERELRSRKQSTFDFAELAKNTLGAFMVQKKFRDLIVHARVFHSLEKIGEKIGYKGQIDQILLDEKALDWAYSINVILTNEFSQLRHCVGSAQFRLSKSHTPQPSPKAPESFEKVRHYQQERKSLGPHPKFPDES